MSETPTEIALRRSTFVAGLLTALTVCSPGGADATPLGSEIQINQTTLGSQLAPHVDASPGGGFRVVWHSRFSPGDDSDSFSILHREIDSEGSPVGNEQQVNLVTTYAQRNARISSRADGSFIVQWSSIVPGNKGPVTALKARPFDASGTGAGTEFQVDIVPNIYTTITQHDVAAAAEGQFVTVSSDFYNNSVSPYQSTLQKKRFDADGNQLESTTLGDSSFAFFYSEIDGNEDDGFVIAWMEADYLVSQYSTAEALRLDADGVSLGSGFSLHPSLQFAGGDSIDVATIPDGEFVAVWNGYEAFYGFSTDIYSRRIDTMDAPDAAGPTRVNIFTSSFDTSSRLARAGDGSFLVVWSTHSPPGDEERGIRGRFLAPDGTPRGEEFRVNTFTTGNQLGPEVEVSDDGKTFLVVWYTESGPGSDTDDFSISGQRFQIGGIFADGFESGDTTRWSTSSP